MCLSSKANFWIRFNSMVITLISFLFLGISILNFWMSDHQSITLLLLVVSVAFAFGFQIYYLFGSMRESSRVDAEWNMRHMFYPLILLYWYSAIFVVNLVKVLAVKYQLHIWQDLLKEDLWQPANVMIIALLIALVVLSLTAVCSARIHYRNSYGYRQYELRAKKRHSDVEQHLLGTEDESKATAGATMYQNLNDVPRPPPTAPPHSSSDGTLYNHHHHHRQRVGGHYD